MDINNQPNPYLTLRDHFAIHAPSPPVDYVEMQMRFDRNRNPYNDSYKPPLRTSEEILAEWRYQWADLMLKVRSKSTSNKGGS
jgi:hypothetical protein